MKRAANFFIALIGMSILLGSGYAMAKPEYALQPGDILEISVWKEPDLQREVLILPDGGLSFPLVGGLNAANRSVADLTAEITEKLSKYIPDPVVIVSARQLLGNRIYVLGKVNKPGEYPVNRNVDVLQALSMAGGLNPYAVGDKIQILRRENGEQTAIAFEYGAAERGDLKQNIVLKAGDIVLVP